MPGANSIVGIQSGLDWVGIVDSMITFERQNAVLLENQQAEKTDIITTLKAAQAKFLALNTKVSRLRTSRTFEAAVITVSDESHLSAQAFGAVGSGSYDIQVLSVARNHQIASQGFSDGSISDFGTGTIVLGVGGHSSKTITIDTGNSSLMGIKNAINDAGAGVTATIVNDGSSSNPYRLILRSDRTGRDNTIEITSNLTGGTNLDFDNASFDDPEAMDMAAGSTSELSLGASASYSGSENKIYTFTVAGTGEQTVGVDVPITINWTDGTNSGSIDVNAADTEVQLTGDGSDGLYLSFAAGTLTAGDQFQTTTFAPLLQEATDAQIAFGSTGGSGSPIVISSETNEFRDVVAGLALTVHKETDTGESITVNTDIDVSAIRTAVKDFISAYNDVMDFIDKQNTYDTETGESGVLFGDLTLRSMQDMLRNALSSTVSGLDSDYNQLYTIGIRHDGYGKLKIADSARFESALRDNPGDIGKLFGNSGNSSNSFIEFIAFGTETTVGQEFAVDITAAATHGVFESANIADPAVTPLTLTSDNNHLQLLVDGATSGEIILTETTYNSYSELVTEIQSKIDSDDNIGNRGLTVEWVAEASGGYLKLTSSGYGSSSRVQIAAGIENAAYADLGMSAGTSTSGTDVAGTINGEEAEGSGLILSGKEGNENTEGLKLKVNLTESQLVTGAEGTITLAKGAGSRLYELINSLTRAGDGTFDCRIRGYQNQVQTLAERVEDIDERLEIRRTTLLEQFYEMELVLGQLSAEQQYLTTQLAALNANWTLGRSKSN